MKKKTERNKGPQFDESGYQANMRDLNGESLPDPAKIDFRPFKHGGARAGAGRKSLGRQPILLRLSPKAIARLRKNAKQTHRSLSDIVEERLAGLVT